MANTHFGAAIFLIGFTCNSRKLSQCKSLARCLGSQTSLKKPTYVRILLPRILEFSRESTFFLTRCNCCIDHSRLFSFLGASYLTLLLALDVEYYNTWSQAAFSFLFTPPACSALSTSMLSVPSAFWELLFFWTSSHIHPQYGLYFSKSPQTQHVQNTCLLSKVWIFSTPHPPHKSKDGFTVQMCRSEILGSFWASAFLHPSCPYKPCWFYLLICPFVSSTFWTLCSSLPQGFWLCYLLGQNISHLSSYFFKKGSHLLESLTYWFIQAWRQKSRWQSFEDLLLNVR